MGISPFIHQELGADKAYEILKNKGLVYLMWEERTGKSLTALLTCDKSAYVKKILILTTLKALKGWQELLEQYPVSFDAELVNYHKADRIKVKDYQVVILDEAHVYLSAYPKRGKIWKTVKPLTEGKFIIFVSATPSAQSYAKLFNQLALSSWGPWSRFKDFYAWHREYGKKEIKYVAGRTINIYDKVDKERIQREVGPYLIHLTRQDIGFSQEPMDQVHFVELEEQTKEWYRQLEKNSLLMLSNDIQIVADTPMALLTKLHQIEGGTIKQEESSYTLVNREKIDYILNTFGDSESLVIFYNYKQEEKKLKSVFKKATILQGSSYAEGVDLSAYDTLVVYSMNFSTSKYVQRRARQANIKREKPIVVHFLCVKGAISDQVYKVVKDNKQNFVDRLYKRGLL